MGGPGFASLSSSSEDEYSFTEQKWTKIFLTYLQDHRHSADFDFFTFEWYPFDDVCAPPAPQLAANPVMMATSIRNLRENILPQDIPIYIMEYGYSSHSGRAQVDIEGALMYADIMGQSLTLGIGKAFLYGYEPTFLDQYNNCSWGNNMLFAMNEKGKIIFHTAAWYGVNMLTHWWAVPVDSALEVYSAKTVLVNEPEQKLITAYAILTPAKKWSIILINKDPKHTWNVDVSIFNTSSAARSALHYPVHMIQYSRLQYHWKANGPKGHPTLALPPIDKMIPSKNIVTLPPYSVTIVREE